LRKPHVTPRFSSTRAPMPLQNVGGFRASPENLLERLWAFSHRSLRRKKGMYLVHIHAKKHEKCENLELGFWVCCVIFTPGPGGQTNLTPRTRINSL
jgi:hypothetical protein